MGKHYLYKQICCIILSAAFFFSCSGQVQTGKSKTISTGQPKLMRTQGTNEYAGVGCGLQDKAGNIWFGTGGEGVYCFDGKAFKNFTSKDGLPSNIVTSILEDQAGKIWLGTNAGLCCYDPSVQQDEKAIFTNIPIVTKDDSSLYTFDERNSASDHPTITRILQDKTGKVWVGTSSNGVYYYDHSTTPGQIRFTHFLHNDDVMNKSNLRLNAVQAILEDKSGNIWFATWFEGICRYDGKSIINFKPNGEVWFDALLEDRTGKIWIGTRFHGAYFYDPSAATRTGPGMFSNIFADVKIFNACCVCAIAEDKAGNIWFGTQFDDLATRDDFGGVWRYTPSASKVDSKTIVNFTTKDGLSHNGVFSVTVNKAGELWFGTLNMGLCRYDGKTITKFSE